MGPVIAKDGYISVLWGQIPHRLSQIDRTGEVFIANLPLPELLSWSMPDRFLSALFTGQVISSTRNEDADSLHFRGGMMIIIHVIQNRSVVTGITAQAAQTVFCRLAFRLLPRQRAGQIRSSQHVHKMIRFLAENYTNPISVADARRRPASRQAMRWARLKNHLANPSTDI